VGKLADALQKIGFLKISDVISAQFEAIFAAGVPENQNP
jgi:hypothetical protein